MSKIAIVVVVLLIVLSGVALAQDQEEGRYKFYPVKSGANELTLLLDSSTGKAWQVFVDPTGKVSHLGAITVEGVAYAPKDNEQLYSKVQSANVDELSTSNSAVKVELDKLYGYGLDNDKLAAIRDKIKAATGTKK